MIREFVNKQSRVNIKFRKMKLFVALMRLIKNISRFIMAFFDLIEIIFTFL